MKPIGTISDHCAALAGRNSVSSRRGFLIGAGAAALASGAPAPAIAQAASGPKAIIELFTSQGCSSCPVADALIESYATRSDILALSYSVDYWDYLGWRDTLASPRFTKRQRMYAKVRGDGQVYTPQTVVNGLTHATGSNRDEIEAAIARTSDRLRSSWTPISLRVDPTTLTIETSAAAVRPEAEATIWLLVVARRVDVAVKRGENAGRTLSYFNVVRDITPVGMWNGTSSTVRIERQSFVPANADMLAVLLQQGQGGPILGADTYRA